MMKKKREGVMIMYTSESELLELREILHSANYAVFFGGAGVSTDSGIPDFRGSKGLYRSDEGANEYLLSSYCLMQEPERFYRFYRENMLYPDAEPNMTHRALAELERQGIIKAVITQNIDGLHQKAGSRRVIELHGTAQETYCARCGKIYDPAYIAAARGVPRCAACGGLIRPAVTLYGESLPGDAFAEAEEEIANADVLIVGGSSLTVQPAASMVGEFQGEHLIIINRDPTGYDGLAEFVIRDSLSDVFEKLL